MQHPANVVSLSGGKDSTAMLLMLLERGEPVADVVFFDTGWEFPEMSNIWKTRSLHRSENHAPAFQDADWRGNGQVAL